MAQPKKLQNTNLTAREFNFVLKDPRVKRFGEIELKSMYTRRAHIKQQRQAHIHKFT